MNRTIRASISTCSSFQIPRSWGLMRPIGTTAVASVKTSAAPPTARLPRCTRCQSVANPSVLEYWHIGETTIRLGNRTSRICRLSNSTGRSWKRKFFDLENRNGAGHPARALNVPRGRRSIVAAMGFRMPVVGHRIEQSKDVLAGLFVEAVDQCGIGGAVLIHELELGIIDNNVTVVPDSKLGSYLQRNFRFRCHGRLRDLQKEVVLTSDSM